MTISREDPRFWDTRLIERRVRGGHITRKDVDKHLKSLPDVADKALTVSIGDDGDLLDDGDDFDADVAHDHGTNGA